MKKIEYIIIILSIFLLAGGYPSVTIDGRQHIPGPITVDGSILKWDDYVNSRVIAETTENTILYVETTGNDNNDCLTVGTACVTIQETVNRIPSIIKHDVSINIGTGNFAGFTVAGFTVPRYVGSLTFQGTLGNPTLGGGTVSGTADGGSTTQCADSGQAWVNNELRGRLVLVNGEYRVVRNNDATSMNLIGPLSATCNGKSYELFEQKTVITSASPDYASANIWVTSNQTGRDNGILFADIKSVGNTYSIFCQYGDGMMWQRIHSINATADLLIQSIGGESRIEDCYASGGFYGFGAVEFGGQLRMVRNYAYDNTYGYYLFGNGAITSTEYLYSDDATNAGFAMGNYAEMYIENLFAENGSDMGILIAASLSCQITDVVSKSNTGSGLVNLGTPISILGTIDISSNGGYGIEMSANVAPVNVLVVHSSVEIAGSATIENNTSGGILAKYKSVVQLNDVDGAGNGGYGLELETDSLGIITTNTGITGITGDATINDGTTTLTWGTDFNDNGDKVINLDNGCSITRDD